MASRVPGVILNLSEIVMKYVPWTDRGKLFALLLLWMCGGRGHAGDLDTIGATLLWQVDATLKGASVHVAQAEGIVDTSAFQVNPAAVGQPVSLFNWISSSGTATTFPNTVGVESWHANTVAANFYGLTTGPAPQASRVDNYEAEHFYNTYIASAPQPSIPAQVVNQSFVFSEGDDATVNPRYDNYAARYGTIFSSGVYFTGTVRAPGTCFNGLGVGIYGSPSAVGPSSDGRCKPDLVAPDAAQYPQGANSYAVPYVSGSAAVLVQAAARGDGGTNTALATDLRTVKALLLNGAVKPSDWTNSPIRPLHLLYGAGIVNLFNSWNQLKGGCQTYVETSSHAVGGAHPPGANLSDQPALTGWDLNSITNAADGPNQWDQVNHYYFRVTKTSTLTATLVWNLQRFKTGINDLNLFLYDTANSNLVASSVSTVDNVEHIFLTTLPPGRYDLQVLKSALSRVSTAETYALAFEFFSMSLSITPSGDGLLVSWPIAPAGFNLYSASSLSAPVWSPVAASTTITNGWHFTSLPLAAGNTFFRLHRP